MSKKRKQRYGADNGLLAIIHWRDANFDGMGQMLTSDAAAHTPRTFPMQTAGFIVNETKAAITVAQDCCDIASTTNEHYRHLYTVPRCNIVKIEVYGGKRGSARGRG